jgi:hypothetical protein
MGSSRDVICESCGHRFQASEGGGFFFHLLHCDLCGREKSVGFDELGDAQPLTEDEYSSVIEQTAGSCDCGGRYQMEAPPRCPVCRSVEFREDPSGTTAMYD